MEPSGRITNVIADPLVSVVIPCYDAAPWIADAIQSALAQTYPRVEVVVIDDGSNDNSQDIIKSFDGRIKFAFLDHKGAPHARNAGWRIAVGEFIQFLDADDILFPHCVGRKVQTIFREGADIVYSGGFFFDVEGNKGNYEPQQGPPNGQGGAVAHIIASTIVTTLLMCRRACLEKVGGLDEQLVKGQEHDLLLRLVVAGFKLSCIPEGLSLNRTGHNPQSITRVTSQDPYHLERLYDRFEKLLENASLWTREVRAALAWRFHFTGMQYLTVHDRSRALRMFQRARQLEKRYMSCLPVTRRLLVPLAGGYFAERFLTKLRQIFPRSIDG